MYPTRSLDSNRRDDADAAELQLLRFKRLDPAALLPTRGSSQSAGLDIYAIEALTIQPGERALARTGLAVAIPEGYYGRLAPRSGLATQKGWTRSPVLLTPTIVVKFVVCSTTPGTKQSTCRRRARSAS